MLSRSDLGALFAEGVADGLGDVDGDGHADLAVGAYTHSSGNGSGRIYLFSGCDGSILRTITNDQGTNEQLGFDAVGMADTNGDGIPEIIGDRHSLGEVFVNVLTNAVEALAASKPEAPSVHIRMRAVDYIPEIKEILERFDGKAEAETQVKALAALLDEVQNSENWKWSINKEDEAVKEERKKRQAEFTERYK